MFNYTQGVTLARGLAASIVLLGAAEAGAALVSFGSAESFAVLAGSAITNTGNTTLTGNVGLSPGATAPSGFGTVTIIGGTLQVTTTAANLAQADALSAFNTLSGFTTTSNLSGQNLGTLTLGPGIYFFEDIAQLTGTLTLSGAGAYVFKIGETFTTAVGSSMILTGGALANDVYFAVGSSATIGGGSVLSGSIVSVTSNSLEAGAVIQGRVIALNGATTMINNTITIPEPTTAGLAILGISIVGLRRRRRSA